MMLKYIMLLISRSCFIH